MHAFCYYTFFFFGNNSKSNESLIILEYDKLVITLKRAIASTVSVAIRDSNTYQKKKKITAKICNDSVNNLCVCLFH